MNPTEFMARAQELCAIVYEEWKNGHYLSDAEALLQGGEHPEHRFEVANNADVALLSRTGISEATSENSNCGGMLPLLAVWFNSGYYGRVFCTLHLEEVQENGSSLLRLGMCTIASVGDKIDMDEQGNERAPQHYYEVVGITGSVADENFTELVRTKAQEFGNHWLEMVRQTIA